MATRYGPWLCPGVVDVGKLMDAVARDVAAAKAKSREDVLRLFEGIKAAHADWLEDYKLSGKALRRAGAPHSVMPMTMLSAGLRRPQRPKRSAQ